MINLGVVMHIDTSCKLYEKTHTGIAFKIVDTGQHRGIGLHLRLKKELERDLETQHDYARLYAICIYYLIKNDLDKFGTLVICGDESFQYVKTYLDLLFSDCKEFFQKNIISISQLRDMLGDQNLRSKANNVANSYRKRALRTRHRQQAGISLNIVDVNYTKIKSAWLEIDEKLKSFVSGE